MNVQVRSYMTKMGGCDMIYIKISVCARATAVSTSLSFSHVPELVPQLSLVKCPSLFFDAKYLSLFEPSAQTTFLKSSTVVPETQTLHFCTSVLLYGKARRAGRPAQQGSRKVAPRGLQAYPNNSKSSSAMRPWGILLMP